MQTSMPQRMHTSGIFINARNNNTIHGGGINEKEKNCFEEIVPFTRFLLFACILPLTDIHHYHDYDLRSFNCAYHSK